jgi:hypothetical protein
MEHFMNSECTLFQDSMEWDSMEVQMDPEVEIFPDGARGRLQRQLWNLFEYPNSSIGAKIIGKSKIKGIVLEEYLRDFLLQCLCCY